MRKRYRPEERERIVAEVRGGTSAKEVAARTGISTSLIYRWLQLSRERSAPKFARVIRTDEASRSALTVLVAGATVHVQTGFDAELLRAVVTALDGVK